MDMHCHVAGIGAGDSGCFISESMRDSFRFGIYLDAFGVSLEDLQNEGDQLVVRRLSDGITASRHVGSAVVLAMDGVVDPQGELDLAQTEVYIPNDFVASETAKYDNLHFGASVNPLRSDALDRLDRVHRQGARLIKWLPSIQNFDPADERIVPFYKKLIELRLPLLTHAGQERSFTRARDELADPERLRLPLQLGVHVIVAHVAATGSNEGQSDYDRLVAMLDEFPNLHSEISSLTQINKINYLPRALREARFENRLYFGSDYPLIATPLMSPWFYPLNLEIREMIRISRIDNPWDRDVELKQALGMPAWIFRKSSELIPSQDSDVASSNRLGPSTERF